MRTPSIQSETIDNIIEPLRTRYGVAHPILEAITRLSKVATPDRLLYTGNCGFPTVCRIGLMRAERCRLSSHEI